MIKRLAINKPGGPLHNSLDMSKNKFNLAPEGAEP